MGDTTVDPLISKFLAWSCAVLVVLCGTVLAGAWCAGLISDIRRAMQSR